MEQSAIDERLRTEPNVWVASVRPDGRPHLTPVWFVFVRERFWIGTGRDAVKTHNVQHNDRVSVSLENGNAPVVAEGSATVHESERPADVVAAFQAKYGWDITRTEDTDVGVVVLWEIAVDRWVFPGG